MSIKHAVRSILEKAAADGALVPGLALGGYTQDTEDNGIPFRLCDDEGTMVEDDRDLDEFRHELRQAGWGSDADYEGVVLAALWQG